MAKRGILPGVSSSGSKITTSSKLNLINTGFITSKTTERPNFGMGDSCGSYQKKAIEISFFQKGDELLGRTDKSMYF